MLNLVKFEKHLSFPRIGTYRKYLKELDLEIDDFDRKIEELYLWNIQASSAFLELFNFYEVVLRNAILQTIQHVHIYSILDARFIRSLPKNVQLELVKTINQTSDTSYRLGEKIDSNVVNVHNVVAQLKFHFWEFLLSERFEEKYWSKYFSRSFPNASSVKKIQQIQEITKEIRKLRNRVCHNEPIFKHCYLWRLYLKSIVVLKLIDRDLAKFVDEHLERLKDLIRAKPI
jgi:hypothetical protein